MPSREAGPSDVEIPRNQNGSTTTDKKKKKKRRYKATGFPMSKSVLRSLIPASAQMTPNSFELIKAANNRFLSKLMECAIDVAETRNAKTIKGQDVLVACNNLSSTFGIDLCSTARKGAFKAIEEKKSK